MEMKCAILILTTASFALAADLPDFIHVCKRNSPQLEKCVAQSVEELRPYLKKGVPSYNIPSLEPLLLNELVASQNKDLRIIAKNVRAYGASDFIVKKLRVNLDELQFAVDIDLPHLYVKGNYEVNGKILLLTIKGSGPMHGNFTKCTGAVTFKVELQENNRVKIARFDVKISIGKGNLRLDNLFDGEETLGEAVNAMINGNFDMFLQELQPLIQKALAKAFRDIGNSIIEPYTFDQLFPSD